MDCGINYKMKKAIILFLILPLLLIISCKSTTTEKKDQAVTGSDNEKAYYVDGIIGSDKNPGTKNKPLKTIAELNLRILKNPGNISFAGGQVFHGTLVMKDIIGTAGKPFKIKSWGIGRSVIDGGNTEAVKIENCKNIWILGLDIKGNGRKSGNTANGLSFTRSSFCRVENINVSGFQKSGVDLYDCTETKVRKVTATDNGFCGINIMGSARNHSRKILIQDCRSENNPGDPTNLDNHSGNGILAGVSDSVTIDHCTATNNGWDMPRVGNGPVGIWAWESDHVTIQYCISYRNKTSENAKDGGGFDLDGGVTNSIIQYCLSYENQGAGYGLFQYAGASPWSNNVVRYCVSINDAKSTRGAGGIFIWNGSDDPKQLSGCKIYNNIVYNTFAPLISYENASLHNDFLFTNNIFLGSVKPIAGIFAGSHFVGNDWWDVSGDKRFLQYTNLEEWSKQTGQEILNGKFAGIQSDPRLKGPFLTDINDPYRLEELTGYILQPDSPLKNKGMNLNYIFGIDLPGKDFFGNPVPAGSGTEPGIYQMN